MNKRMMRKITALCYGSVSSLVHLTFILHVEEAWTC